MAIFCSTIIPRVGRNTLRAAVYSVLEQDFCTDELEVVVVNDSGKPLPPDDWQALPQVRIVETNRRERCIARNTGAALSHGKYLHFLDDDDLLLPGAMAEFAALDGASAGVWLYGSYQTVDNDGNLIAVWRPGIVGNIYAYLIAGESIPFQTSLLRSDCFHTIGTFDPHPSIVGVEDRDVGRRMGLAGDVSYTPAIVAQIRIGEQGSTTNWKTLGASDRWGREKALRLAGTPARLRRSATDPNLRGRVARAYLASAAWNVEHHDLWTAAHRITTGFMFSGRHLFSPSYWRGLRSRST
jgi:glycosyltransferase involved in cell wall biosynthesis